MVYYYHFHSIYIINYPLGISLHMDCISSYETYLPGMPHLSDGKLQYPEVGKYLPMLIYI
jgi:hypothetical protein